MDTNRYSTKIRVVLGAVAVSCVMNVAVFAAQPQLHRFKQIHNTWVRKCLPQRVAVAADNGLDAIHRAAKLTKNIARRMWFRRKALMIAAASMPLAYAAFRYAPCTPRPALVGTAAMSMMFGSGVAAVYKVSGDSFYDEAVGIMREVIKN